MTAVLTVDHLYALYNAVANRQWDPLREALHVDCVLGAPGTLLGGRFDGADAVIARMQQWQALFGGTLQYTYHWSLLSSNGERGVVQWYCHGHPERGGTYRNRGVTLFRLRDGLVIDWQEFYDTEVVAAIWPREEAAPPTEEMALTIWPEEEERVARGDLELLLSRAEPMDNDWA